MTLTPIRATLIRVHFQEPIIIIRLSQPLTIKVETDDGRREMDLVLDFHFQKIARLVFYGDFYADDVTKAFKNAL